jgi:hypothetical protein
LLSGPAPGTAAAHVRPPPNARILLGAMGIRSPIRIHCIQPVMKSLPFNRSAFAEAFSLKPHQNLLDPINTSCHLESLWSKYAHTTIATLISQPLAERLSFADTCSAKNPLHNGKDCSYVTVKDYVGARTI